MPGTPLAIGASTVAGAALMRNLGLMGGQGLSGVTPQLLLGTTGAVIGFGTSWGLSRFGFKPTVEQAAWFTNATAWGTLAGLAVWGASGSTSPKLEYGSLVLGEAVGMGAGVWSAHSWRWSLPQVALADSFVLGTGLTTFGFGLIADAKPAISTSEAVGLPVVMIAAALAAHQMSPTSADLRLMTLGALASGWSGGLLAAGAAGTTFLGSRESQGGAIAGLGVGYLAASAAGAFTEVSGTRVGVTTAGLLAGNVLGLGLHMTVQGFAGGDPFSAAEVNRRALSAGVGGLVIGAAAYAYAPHLELRPSVLPMTVAGALGGAGAWGLAWEAGYGGTARTQAGDARLAGGLLVGASVGGISGLVASRWFAPDAADQATAWASAALGLGAGVGVARLTIDARGPSDVVGGILGAGVGLGVGATTAHRTRLRAPDLGAGIAGLGYGALAGALAPTLGDAQWNDGRRTSGGALLGIGLGAAGGVTAAHLLEARPGQVVLPAVAGTLGLGIGVGAGLLWPCSTQDGCTSQAPRVGAVAGPLVLAGGALALDAKLGLSRGLGPDAPALGGLGLSYGAAWGLLVAGALDPSGLIGGTPGRQLGGGALMGASAGLASGLALSKLYGPTTGDIVLAFATSVGGAALGLGIPQLTTAAAGRFDTLGVLAGSSGGLLAGALLAPGLTIRPPEIGAGAVGLSAGALVGTLAPSLADPAWDGGRRASGGALVGFAVGGAGAVIAAHAAEATDGQVAVATGGAALGIGTGLGAGLMWPTPTSQPARIGTVAGALGGAGLSLVADRWLHLSGGVPDSAPALATLGGALGAGEGLLLSGAVDPSGLVSSTPQRQRWGGVLLGGSTGIAAGLALSPFFAPTGERLLFATGADLGGGALGLGIAQLSFAETGRHDTVAALLGSTGGLAVGALLAPRLRLTGVDAGAAALGAAYGSLIGTLVPSLGDATWDGGRRAAGGALVGLSLGAGGALLATDVTDASGAQLAVPAVAGLLGTAAGYGAGLAVPTASLRPARIGTVAGAAGGIALGVLGDVSLDLDEGLGPDHAQLGWLGGILGLTDGLLFAGAIDPSGVISGTPARQVWGGMLMGASAEVGAGLVASRYVRLPEGSSVALVGGKLAGGMLGLGATMLARPDTGRADTVAALAGSIAGVGAAATVEITSPLDKTDALAALVGAGYGGFIGALAPTLNEPTWSGLDHRRTGGGLLLGLGGGAIGGAALGHAFDVEPRTVGLATLGGADGLLTGLGVGLLVDSRPSTEPTDRAERIGMVAGTGAGLAVGALVWPRLELASGGPLFITAATAVGGWTGFWVPALGHPDSAAINSQARTGATLAGAGIASFGASLLAPVLKPDADLVENALAVGALWSAAGAGAGALVSTRDDAPVWGLLGAGTAGLLAGGALHRSIEIDGDDAPLLTLAGAEGLWLGGWLPYLLYDASVVTGRERAGGLAAGALGGLGLAAVSSSALEMEPARAGFAGLGSGLGAAIGGGIALMSPDLHDRGGVGLMLGGTAAGLAAGAALAPRLSMAPTSWMVGATTAGGTLGLSEALLFAWSGHASGTDQFAGAALLGGGVGAALGLATAAAPPEQVSGAPAAAGFAAWGAWTGSFTGSLFRNDAHEVVLGGLVGANAGFLGGYALLRTGAVEARDFGWLSLFGALGTVVGAGVGAPFSSTSQPAPVLAGLAAGPVVGMTAGALILPRLRRLGSPGGASTNVASARFPGRLLRAFGLRPAPAPASEPPAEKLTLSSEILAAPGGPGSSPSLLARLCRVVEVTEWSPLVGALPTPDQLGPPPLLFGVTGLWR
jgi:hypothetical protein